jgi:hypothetical protein
MEFYYRKLMGNGAIATKFRLNGNTPVGIQLKQSNLREQHLAIPNPEQIMPETGDKSVILDKKVDEALPIKEPSGTVTITAKPETLAWGHHESQGRGIVFSINGKNEGVETPKTHHPNNCNRCYRLKKKCLREYPQCNNCGKSGNNCEYTTRNNKRRKRLQDTVGSLVVISSNNPSQESQQVYDIVETNSKNGKEVVAHKLVSVSSLLSSDTSENLARVESTRRVVKKIPSAVLSTTGRREQGIRDKSLHNKLLVNGLKVSSTTNLKEEFINLKSFPDKLATKFADNYFENYAYKYPFINKLEMLSKINNIEFKSESIVNLDIYLLLSIGCLIDDSKYLHNINKNQYQTYFGDKGIESIVDMLNFTTSSNSQERLETLKLLLLLSIHSMTSMNEQLCWTLMGILNRMVIQFDLYKRPSTCEEERIFWSIFNMDKELSFLLNKPSQLPISDYIGQSLPIEKLYEVENIELICQEIRFNQLQDTILGIHLSNKRQEEDLLDISKNLEKWRISTSSVIHKTYSSSPFLQELKSIVDLNYYYLLIEIDQLSSSESLQFPLHFLSNSFSMILSEAEFDKKDKSYHKLTLSSSLFWFKRLFKVVRYSLKSMMNILQSIQNKLELSIKMSEFNGNLQLTLNLLKFISGKLNFEVVERDTGNELVDAISTTLVNLNSLNSKLVQLNIMTSNDKERQDLINEIVVIQTNLSFQL